MILKGIINAFMPGNLLMALLGTTLGIVMGALPGIGSTMTMALLLPFTFWMSPAAALILLGSVYCGATYGGSISAILLNTPGTPASSATAFDGYPLAQKGKGMNAIGISAMASFIGGTAGLLFLLFLAPPLADISLLFGPAEFFLLTLFTFLIISVTILKESVFKGLIALSAGMILATIGYDPVSGNVRFSFDISYLEDGIQLLPAIIGLFAVSEVFSLIEKGGTISSTPDAQGSIWQGFADTFKYPRTLTESTLIGSGIGALPGIGVSAANIIAYVVAKSHSSHASDFGTGAEEGVVAPEASNNAVTCTSLIPALTLGIPGSSSAAVLLGALMIHGLIPGAGLFTESGEVTYTFIFGLGISNFCMLLVTVLFARLLVKITVVNVSVLTPIITSLCFIGAYSLRTSMGDVIVACVFGVVGYVMRRLRYPIICLLLPLILGSMMERGFHQALMISGGSYGIFVQSPISKVIACMIVLSLLWPVFGWLRQRAAK